MKQCDGLPGDMVSLCEDIQNPAIQYSEQPALEDCFEQRIGLNDLQRFLPTPVIL